MVERALPVFSALIASDTANHYHRNHAQLAFSFQSQCTKESWEKAKNELDIAIKIRGPSRIAGFANYEYNRALCKIQLDPNYWKEKPEPAAEQTKDEHPRRS